MSPGDETKIVCIWEDKDKSKTGEVKAIELADKLSAMGIQVFRFIPPGKIPEGAKSVDWLDVLNNNGAKFIHRQYHNAMDKFKAA